MQKKRNIQLLFAFGYITATIVLLGLFLNRKDDTVTVDKNLFRLEDYKTIDNVLLTKGGKAIELKFISVQIKIRHTKLSANFQKGFLMCRPMQSTTSQISIFE